MTETAQKVAPKDPLVLPVATKVEIHLRGRDYTIACDPGEEAKLAKIVGIVEEKLEEVSTLGTNNSEVRMFMMACLVLADELIETRKLTAKNRQSDEDLMIAAVDHLRERIMTIAEKVG